MRSSITEIESLQYVPFHCHDFICRGYQGLDENGVLDYCESYASEAWVFVNSNCPYTSLRSKCLYSEKEYPYPLNKYGGTELNLRYYL